MEDLELEEWSHSSADLRMGHPQTLVLFLICVY